MKTLRVCVAAIVAALSVGLTGCSPGGSEGGTDEAQAAVSVSPVAGAGKGEKKSPDFLKEPLVVGEYPALDFSLDVPVVCKEIPVQFLEEVLDSRLSLDMSDKGGFANASVCSFRDKGPKENLPAYRYYVAMDMAPKESVTKEGEVLHDSVSAKYPAMYAHYFEESSQACTASIPTTRGALRLSYEPSLGEMQWPPQPKKYCPRAVSTLEKLISELGG
ncbi:Uncharacterised protein [Corynebacterium renale]|uniref:DUF3558 domain-containing protein n=1 Tax=Corynebacterium renale TaxID=1724 RepID=A0A2A9DQF5_9CORY|nr:hypothetical protein [Corynebacterium renale]PFG28140.1 hypothetical protein ATK06_1234 [Corynebacterium renale]SQG65269.1 Uncharacterised protein [Corynebacterium renale]SQI20381.1 Uncharacterised protein [Corynebacterium renale]STC98552.1 Uncharacterised protein [Corynebacterium renale]